MTREARSSLIGDLEIEIEFDAPIGARSPTQPFARTQTHPPQNTTLPTPVHTIGFEGAASSLPAVS